MNLRIVNPISRLLSVLSGAIDFLSDQKVDGLRSAQTSGLGLIVLMLLVFTPYAGAGDTGVKAVEQLRLWRAPDNTRLVFDLSGPISHQLFELENPHRVVIDLDSAKYKASSSSLDLAKTPIADIRTGHRKDGGLRVVLDLENKVKPRSFSLLPNEQYGHRLVVDLSDIDKQQSGSAVKTVTAGDRDIVIAIDAGHGGEDPGALGPNGLLEKKVVLDISKKLVSAIDNQKGYKAVLVRSSDYYIPLRKRFAKAREAKADLFISIHADSFRLASVRGASVYALSTQGATSETASYLAEKGNRADLIGGAGTLTLKDKDDQLASVLLDLSMNASIDAGLKVGNLVLQEMGGVTKLHKKRVEQAGFAVLKSPDVPSLLIETGFISNPTDAKQLASNRFQRSLATAIFRGIKSYFNQYAPSGTLVAAYRDSGKSLEPVSYKIERGDTLSEIAQRYQVSTRSLKELNGLRGSKIKVGQTLRIPAI